MATDALVVRVSADLKNYEKEMKKISDQTQALAETLAEVGKVSAVAFAGLATAIGLNIREFAKFDNEIRAVKTLLDESSFGAKGLEEGFKDMKDQALDLARTVPGSISSMNKALFDTVSAGVDAAKAVDVVAVASKLAVAGVTDLSVATDGLTSALNAYSISADQAEGVAAKFFTAQKFGKTTIEDLSSGFGKVGASASALGVSLDEVLATVSAVTLGGVKTAEAYTGLKAVLTGIAKPTSDAKEEAKRLGVEFDATALRTKGLEGFLNDLTSANGFTKDSITKLFGSIEAANVLFALTGNQAKAFGSILSELSNEIKTVDTFTKAYGTQNQSTSNQLEIFKNKLQVAAIQIGEHLTPAFNQVLGAGAKFMDMITANEGFSAFVAISLAAGAALTGLVATFTLVGSAALQFRTVVLGLTGAKTLAAAASMGWATANKVLIGTLAVLTAPVTLVVAAVVAAVAAIGAAAYAVYAFRDEIVASISATWSFISTAFGGMGEIISSFGQLMLGAITGDFDKVAEGAKRFSASVTETFREAGNNAADAYNAGMEKIKSPNVDNSPMPETQSPLISGAMAGLPGGAGGFYEELIRAQEEAQARKETSLSAHEERMERIKRDALQRQAAIAKEFNDQLEAVQNENRTKELETAFTQGQQLQLAEAEHNNRMLEYKLQAQEAARTANLTDHQLTEEARAAHFLKLAEIENQRRTLDAETKLTDDELKRQLQAQHENEILRIREEARLMDLDAENRVARERIQADLKEKNLRKEEEIKYGKAIAETRALFRSEDFKNTSQVLGNLANLQRSKNKELFEIGKAAAMASAVVNIAQGVTEAWKMGPILGPIGAAAVIAAGAVQISSISGQGLAMAQGGIVTGGIPGKDSVPILGMPGELMVPTNNFEEVVNAVASKRIGEGLNMNPEGQAMEVIIGFRDDAFQIIESKLIQRRTLGVGMS